MKISGHKTRSVFIRNNITNEEDLKEAASKLGDFIQQKKVTLLVTPEEFTDQSGEGSRVEIVDRIEEKLELAKGIEPPTCGLQNRCSAD